MLTSLLVTQEQSAWARWIMGHGVQPPCQLHTSSCNSQVWRGLCPTNNCSLASSCLCEQNAIVNTAPNISSTTWWWSATSMAVNFQMPWSSQYTELHQRYTPKSLVYHDVSFMHLQNIGPNHWICLLHLEIHLYHIHTYPKKSCNVVKTPS